MFMANMESGVTAGAEQASLAHCGTVFTQQPNHQAAPQARVVAMHKRRSHVRSLDLLLLPPNLLVATAMTTMQEVGMAATLMDRWSVDGIVSGN
jgi:hypothetical protein